MFTFPLTEGAALRLWEDSDDEELAQLVDANRRRLARWMPWAAENTIEDTRDYLRRSRREWAARQSLQTALVRDGAIAGAVGLNRLDWFHRQTEIGYWVDAGSEGRGLITAATRALIDHCFGALKLHRIEIKAATDNTRSQRVPERLGFTREGTVRGAERIGDRYLDLVIFGLLAPEWAPAGAVDLS